MQSKTTWASLSHEERGRLELLVCDAIGVAAAGSVAPGVESMLRALDDLGGGEITPLWTELHVNAPAAGLALSLLIHAWDFDDTHDEAVVHTASVAVAASFAIAQLDPDVTGERLLDGIVAGIQALARLSRLVGPSQGVIRTAGLGAVAAAVAAATTLDLSDADVRSAAGLALAGSMSPSTRQAVVDGSLAKRLQPGLAVQTGITAALLARRGIAGPKGWLAGAYGLLPGSPVEFDELFTGPFELAGIALKPYPACRYTHAALAAAHEALPRVDADAVEGITVHVPDGDAYRLVSRPYEDRGTPIIDAQFSIPWQVAAVAVTGRYALSTLHGPDLQDPEIPAFARKVRVLQDLPPSDVMSEAVVDVALAGGDVLTTRAPMPGSPQNPLSWEQLAGKIDSCLEVTTRTADAERIRAFVRSLPHARPGTLPRMFRDLTAHAVPAEKE